MIRNRNVFRQEYKHAQGWWEDLRFPAAAFRLDSAATRYSYDFVNLGVEFDDNARYTEEVIGIIAQMSHGYLLGSGIDIHLHWEQNQNAVPNWLMDYRAYDIGEASNGSWTTVTGTTVEIAYSSGSIHNITEFVSDWDPGLSEVSGLVEIKLWRDTANTSGEFAGADGYTGGALTKEIDIHYQIDQPGSLGEYSKWNA